MVNRSEDIEIIDQHSLEWSGVTSNGYTKTITYPKDGHAIVAITGFANGSSARFTITHSANIVELQKNSFYGGNSGWFYVNVYLLEVHSNDTTYISCWGYGSNIKEGYIAYYC